MMKTTNLPQWVRLALPYAVLSQPDMVRLVAGEDFRYTLRSPCLDKWLPTLLMQFERPTDWVALIKDLPAERQQPALEIITRLYGERVLMEDPVQISQIHNAVSWVVEGNGKLSDRVKSTAPTGSADTARLVVLCQDNLDYAAALDFQRRQKKSDVLGWLWVSCGAMTRGFVSPVFRANAGPCLCCLFRNFQRLSPAPEIYDHLIAHSRSGGTIPAMPFPEPALDMLINLARWKLEASVNADLPAAVYRLHVLEINSMECTAHRVFRDSECPECSAT